MDFIREYQIFKGYEGMVGLLILKYSDWENAFYMSKWHPELWRE